MLIDIAFVILACVAAMIATLSGFGSSMLLIPVAVMFMDAKTAIFLVACFHLFNNAFKVKAFWGKIDFRTFMLFGTSSVVCAFTGAMLITAVPVDLIRKAIAVFLVLFSAYSLLRPGFTVKRTRVTAVAGGGLSGLLAGLIGLGGAIRSTFLIAFDLPKEVYVGTSAMIALVIDLTRVPTYIVNRIVRDTSYYALLPFLVLSAYFGVKAGKKLIGRVDQYTFRRIVLAAILLVGVRLLF